MLHKISKKTMRSKDFSNASVRKAGYRTFIGKEPHKGETLYRTPRGWFLLVASTSYEVSISSAQRWLQDCKINFRIWNV